MTAPLSGISFEIGLKHCFGKREIYHKVLRMFLTTRRTTMADMRVALQQGDSSAASLIAHTLKSNAGTLGAQSLAEAARLLEVAIESDQPRSALAPESASQTQTSANVNALLLLCERDLNIILAGIDAYFQNAADE